MRLIEDNVELHSLRNAGEDSHDGILDPFDRLNGIRSGLAVDRYVHLALAINVNDVGLNSEGIFDRADVFHKDWSAVFDLDREVVNLFNGSGHAVGGDLIVQIPDLCLPGRDEYVGVPERLGHVGRSKPVPSQLVRVEIDKNSPQLAAIYSRRDDARDATQLIPDGKIRDVVELLF